MTPPLLRTRPLDAGGNIANVPIGMSAIHELRATPGLVRRFMAAGCAALVLALTIFAACPTAHSLLHDDSHQHAVSDEPCAVVMFASGVSLPVAPLALTPPIAIRQVIPHVTRSDVFLVSPRYLRQPERGPPSSWIS